MVRILGNNLSSKKCVHIALTDIYGIGKSSSKKVLTALNIDLHKKVFALTEKEISEIREFLEQSEFKLEGELRRFTSINIKRLVDIKSFRGLRLLKGLPVRGQRTRTNSRNSRHSNIFLEKMKH